MSTDYDRGRENGRAGRLSTRRARRIRDPHQLHRHRRRRQRRRHLLDRRPQGEAVSDHDSLCPTAWGGPCYCSDLARRELRAWREGYDEGIRVAGADRP